MKAQFKELDAVRLTRDLSGGGVTIPAGCIGTVLLVYAGGEAFEVEFMNGPDDWFETLAVNPDDLEPYNLP